METRTKIKNHILTAIKSGERTLFDSDTEIEKYLDESSVWTKTSRTVGNMHRDTYINSNSTIKIECSEGFMGQMFRSGIVVEKL